MNLLVTKLSSILIFITIHSIAANADRHWDYGHQRDWVQVSESCGGRRQSPIDIDDICDGGSSTIVDTSLNLVYDHFNKPLRKDSVRLVNNGHSAQLTLIGGDVKNDWAPKVTGSAVNGHVYQFSQLHFHWDQNDTHGSEHSIHGSREALELHMVLYNTKYGSFDEAGKHGDGLVVLATLFHADVMENPILNPIVNNLRSVITAGDRTLIEEPIILGNFIPEAKDIFYTYQGSLTTPPCSEIVTWIIYTQVPRIGYSQLAEFEQLDNNENSFVGDTNRYLQSLNGRNVYASNDEHCKQIKDRKKISNTGAILKETKSILKPYFREVFQG